METIIKKISFLIILFVFSTGCISTKSPRKPLLKIPIVININTDNSVDFTNLNTDLYRLKVKDFLDNFREVDLVFAESDEEARVTLDIGVENFNIFPKEEQISRRSFSRNIQVGTGANGQATYQTVTATVDLVQTRIRSSAVLSSKFTFKDKSYRVPPQTNFANYTWENISVENIQGDPRAIDASVYAGRSMISMEPFAEDFLMGLSNRDLMKRIAFDLSNYYRKLNIYH
ncbi:MAG TPA: hypothetical protein DIT07_00060 [Sphingobacteriaceae bacterium]|nr:hypothetical protein [Sphingobacteriaceae bacterium]